MVTTRTGHKLGDKGFEHPTKDSAHTSGKDGAFNAPNDPTEAEPNRKRRRVSKLSREAAAAQAPTMDHKGKSKAITDDVVKGAIEDLPLDLIFEIFSLLHPLDLLQLTLTSKAIRGVLMSKTSISVWKASRLALEPPAPECPPDQSEPQWAALLYETRCMICGSDGSTTTEWNFRLRGCWRCFGKVLVGHRNITKQFPQIKDLIRRRKVSDRVPQFESLNHRRKIKEGCPQAEDVEEILALLPHTQRRWRKDKMWYLRSSVKTTIAALLSLQDEMRLQVQGAKERRDVFKEARQQEVSAIMALEPVMKQWVDDKEPKFRLGGCMCNLCTPATPRQGSIQPWAFSDPDVSGTTPDPDAFSYDLDQLLMTEDFGAQPDTTVAGRSGFGGFSNELEGAANTTE